MGIVDQLLPEHVEAKAIEWESNWVLCCALCSTGKRDWNPNEGMSIKSAAELWRLRKELISQARAHIYDWLAQTHVPDRLRVLRVMDERDTE